MAAITTRLLHLRPTPRPYPLSFHHHFSSSTSSDDPPPPQPDPETTPENQFNKPQTSFSSYFSDVKATLQNQQRPQPPRLDEIRRNLSQFRLRVDPPPSSNSPPISFQQMYNNINSRESNPNFPSMADRVRQMSSPGSQPADSPYLNRLRSLRPNASVAIGGGGVSFPKFNLGDAARTEAKKLFKSYNPSDLGKKLQDLRPKKRDGEWFSFQELNDRLALLKETEEKQSAMRGGSHMSSLRESLFKLQEGEVANDKLKIAQKLQNLRHLGGTPSYMLQPPKEELVKQYFHPDMMSAAEKMKLELKKVRDEFKMSESDCGSTRVQIAQLTTKIKYLVSVLAKKDKHSRKGLHEMVAQRKKLLKYLRRTDWDSYCLVLSKLGLRDNIQAKPYENFRR